MALPTLYTPPKDAGELEKRKVLASALKDFAAGNSPETAQSLMAQGEKIGVTRNQLSNLYNQYKKEGVTSTPLSAPPEAYGPPSALANQTTPSPTTTPSPAEPSSMFSDYGVREGPVFANAGPETKGLDRLAAMQGTPMGSVSIGAKGVQGATGGLAKGPSRTGGTPIGRGIGIGASPFGSRSSAARQMNAITGANLFRAEQERFQQQEQQNLENERIRAEIDAYKKANRPPEYTKQPAFENANEKIPLFLRR